MAETGQGRQPIQFMATGERKYSRKLFREGMYEVIVEYFFVDQYGRQWHSFDKRWVHEEDLPPSQDHTDG